MTFYEKYIKYKNKYNALKSQLGGNMLKCDDAITLGNRYGSCWNVSIQMIFLFGNNTSCDTQKRLGNSQAIIDEILQNNELRECLPFDFFEDDKYTNNLKPDVNIKLVKLFNDFYTRFLIKKDDRLVMDKKSSLNPVLVLERQESKLCETNFNNSYFNLIYNKPAIIDVGGYQIDEYLRILLFSIFLCKKPIEYNVLINCVTDLDYSNKLNKYFINDIIPMKIIHDSLGILICYRGHTCACYKCDDKYKFYDSYNEQSLQNFDIIGFIEIINEHIAKKLKFKIYQYMHMYKSSDDIINATKNLPFLISIETDFIYYHNDNTITKSPIDKYRQSSIAYATNAYFSLETIAILNFSNLSTTQYKQKYKSLYLDYYIKNKRIHFDKLKKHYCTIDDKLNLKDIFGNTLANLSYKEKDFERCKMLLTKENINIPNITGESLLTKAIVDKNYELVQFIINKIEIIDIGKLIEIVPLLIKDKKNELVQLIIDKFEVIDYVKLIRKLIYYDNYKEAIFILNKTEDDSLPGELLQEYLFTAIDLGEDTLAKLIINKCKNINEFNTDYNMTPLNFAIENYEDALALLILNKSKNIDITALTEAIKKEKICLATLILQKLDNTKYDLQSIYDEYAERITNHSLIQLFKKKLSKKIS